MKLFQSLVGLLRREARRPSIPLILFFVAALAYGWQITRLGFYWDDWVFVSRYQALGVLNTIFYGGTRQLGVFALMPGFLLAGDSPLLWHIYSLLLRWVVALLFWWALNKLWPGQKTSITLMAALFSVHPAFSQQSIAVVYSLQLVTYAIFLASFGLMISAERAISEPNIKNQTLKIDKWLPSMVFVLAILTQGLHLFIVEYFVGLELIRPLALYLLQKQGNRLQRFKTAFIHWLPYLFVLIIYAVWRSGWFGTGFDTYEYKTITAFFRSDSRAAIVEVLEYGLKDILVLLVNTWSSTLAPSIIDLSQPYNFFSLLVAGLATYALYLFVPLADPLLATNENAGTANFLRQAAALGLLAVLVSFIPSWFVRRHIVEPGNFGDRFALAGLFGASILLVVFTQFLTGQSGPGISYGTGFTDPRGKSVLFASLFIGLAIGAQIRFANNYRWDWERQLRTYWQVFWRAPALQPGTVLVGYDAISLTTVNYVGAFAFNDLYQYSPWSAPPPASPRSAIWYVNYPKTSIAASLDKFLASDWVYVDEFDNISVTVRPNNSLGVDYSEDRCVKILTSDDLFNYNIPADFRPIAGFSNPALINHPSRAAISNPPEHIFGLAPLASKTWCYYYQKAELARQLGDWDGVVALKKEADKAGLGPFNAYELFPFIEAYAMRAEWETAEKLSSQAYKSLPKSLDGICLIWKRSGDLLVNRPVENKSSTFQLMNCQ